MMALIKYKSLYKEIEFKNYLHTVGDRSTRLMFTFRSGVCVCGGGGGGGGGGVLLSVFSTLDNFNKAGFILGCENWVSMI